MMQAHEAQAGSLHLVVKEIHCLSDSGGLPITPNESVKN